MILIDIISNYIYFKFYKFSTKYISLNIHNLHLRNIIRKKTYSFLIFLFIIFAFYLVKIKYWNFEGIPLIDQFLYLVSVTVIIVYGIELIVIFFIRKKRILKSKDITNLDYYFFSKEAIRYKFKNLISLIIFCASMGLVLFPLFFNISEVIENKATGVLISSVYSQQNWETIEKCGYASETDNYNPKLLPVPDDISYQGVMAFYSKIRSLLAYFQNKMFFLLTFIFFFEIGTPSLINVIIYQSKRTAFKRIVISVIKSTGTIIILKFIFSNVFFIDTSSIINSTTIFFFMFTIFHMQQNSNIKMGK